MKNIILIIFLISSSLAFAQSKLPNCKGSDYKKYNNCFSEVIDKNGNYKGEFKNGKYHGQGTYTSKKNNKFVGEFSDGKKKFGTYTFTFREDKILINNFKHGNYYGKGNISDKESTYVGELVLKEKNNDEIELLPHGHGTITFGNGPNRDKYVGNYKDGKAHGQGTYTYKNGNKYVGNHKDGKAHGQGTYTFKDGTKNIGEFKDGAFVGK